MSFARPDHLASKSLSRARQTDVPPIHEALGRDYVLVQTDYICI